MATLTLTADFRTVESGWIQARLVDVPGVITCARGQSWMRGDTATDPPPERSGPCPRARETSSSPIG